MHSTCDDMQLVVLDKSCENEGSLGKGLACEEECLLVLFLQKWVWINSQLSIAFRQESWQWNQQVSFLPRC